MEPLLEWLAQYSPIVVALLVLGAVVVYAGRELLERAIAARVDLVVREQGLSLERRSAFENRVLTDRYEAFNDLVRRIVGISTDLNRARTGARPHHDPLVVDGELVPLTAVYEDVIRHRLLLGEELHEALTVAVQATLGMSNAADAAAFSAASTTLTAALTRLREAGEAQFGLSRIRW